MPATSPTVYQQWNSLRQFVVCSTPSCGRAVYVGEAIERVHGRVIGKQVKDILSGLSRVAGRGREPLANLVELTERRLEALLKEHV